MTPDQIAEAARLLKEREAALNEMAEFQRTAFGDEAKRRDATHVGRLMLTTPNPGGMTLVLDVRRSSGIAEAIERELVLKADLATAACVKAGVTL